MEILRRILRAILARLYRVKIIGVEHYHSASKPVLIVANHTSFLDPLLLAVFLPEKPTFAISPHIAAVWWMRPFKGLVELFPVDPLSPMALKSLIHHLRRNRTTVIFPEGRITVTGSLMKIYDGPGLVAEKAGATLLPIRVDGPQYTPFSRLRGRVRLRWFPPVTLTLLPPRRLSAPQGEGGQRSRRSVLGAQLADLMTEMVFTTSNYRRTLFSALLEARRIHGGGHVVAEDTDRRPLNYHQLIERSLIVGNLLVRQTRPGETVGILLPNALGALVVFLGLHKGNRVPALLNFTLGPQGILAALASAAIRTVYTSRRFVAQTKLEEVVARVAREVQVVYLEDLATQIGFGQKLKGWIAARMMGFFQRQPSPATPDDPAVVLFTSGSEGTPKGVVLSHANLLANVEQAASRFDFSCRDTVLNALPMFHSFGLTAGTLLPVLSGMKVFLYPSPLHYHIVPELAYQINATVLFGTNTFLNGYARHAHPYDFYSLRYVIAGAEKLQPTTWKLWAEKFGVRIFEGYGATETSPVLSVNTPLENRLGSVGRLLPGIQYSLEPVAGIAEGGRLQVRGPNVMLGYLFADRPGSIQPPQTHLGKGWYDTGDMVRVDTGGYLWILGRAKRFAKVGGEMVSLATVEHLVGNLWPDHLHAAVSLPDPVRGEQVILLSEYPSAERQAIVKEAQKEGLSELHIPRRIFIVETLPVLGSGKVNYPAAQELAKRTLLQDD